MTKSGTFGDDADAMASQHGEFLAGVLAMARISRVTVALENGTDAGPALLEAARLTGHAETCLLFEDWEQEPLPALLSAAARAIPDHVPTALPSAGDAGQALRQLLHQAQNRRRCSFLLILNRLERLLARPTHDPHYQAVEQALVSLAEDRELDLHLLLVMDESAEFLLTRLEHRMPGIGDGCLRIPASSQDLPAPGPATTSGGTNRDRSFGMLLERLTAKAPFEQAGQALQRHEPDQAHAGTDGSDAGFASAAPTPPAEEDSVAAQPQPVAFTAADETPDAPDAPDRDKHAALEGRDSQADGQQDSHAAHPSSPLAASAAQPGRRRPWALALALLVAAGAGLLVWQGLPVTDSGSSAATGPAAPAAATQTQFGPAPGVKVADAPQPVAPVALAPSGSLADAPKPSVPDRPAGASAPDNTASGPASSAAAPATPASVYVHVRDAREREQVQAQRRALGTQGIRLMEVKIMSKGPSVADLRYFHDEDREEALAVQKALLAAGVPVARLSRMNGFEGSTRRRHYEAWLPGPGQPGPARR